MKFKILFFFSLFIIFNGLCSYNSPLFSGDSKAIECHSCSKRDKRPQKLADYECRQECRKLANRLRSLVEGLVRDSDHGFFKKIQLLRIYYPYIDSLERLSLQCCFNGNTDHCLNPLVEQITLWNNKGLADDISKGLPKPK